MMVVPSEQFCGHHGLPNQAIRVRPSHHQRPTPCNADPAGGPVILAQLPIRHAEMSRVARGNRTPGLPQIPA